MAAEIMNGTLRLSPRPASPHAVAASVLGEELGPPFKRGRGGLGGWIILDEFELHLAEKFLVPDLSGWRRMRMAKTGDVSYFDLLPDWVCEVASPSRTLEAYRLQGSQWLLLATHKDSERPRIEPFEALELDLALLWEDKR